ncbi:MAG TPA: HDIG domain-containing protein, partial [Gemmatimonadales bacterium]|nr:HDIG domain-containing protein [Gemmatimonadales bacterium]
ERAREAENLAGTVKPILRFNPEGVQVGILAADRFFAALDSAAAAGADLTEVAGTHGILLDTTELQLIRRPAQRSALRDALVRSLARAAEGYLPVGLSRAELGREVVLRRGGSERVVPTESLPTFGELLSRVAQEGGTPERTALLERLIGAFYRPTLVYERDETERRRDALRATVDSVDTVVLAGQRIVAAHEVITERAARQIDALRLALNADGRRFSVLGGLGLLGLNALIVGLFGVMLFFFRPQIYHAMRSMVFFAGSFALVAVAAGILVRQSPVRIELIPVALPVFLLAVLFDGRIAAVAAMALAALLGSQPALRGTEALVFCFVSGVAAALSMRRIRSRTQAWASIITVAAIYAAAAALSGAAAAEPISSIGTSAALGGVNALGSAALAMLVLPLAEHWTRSTTDLRLLELADPNHPLLRRLATEAPGTYAHSVSMANLCEAACNAIGANGLLARVGCYYHDVGKLTNPQLFVENLGRLRNPHDHLPPAQSAALIRRHVEDGIALARAHRIPEVIVQFIPEHHGTQEIRYFLDRAREQGGADLNSEVFRYPGPKPRSAETAVTLLADAVEAAVRVLDEPTPEVLADAIEHLVEDRIESGQLREAPLTLREIDQVKEEFVRVLSSMYHERIEYPEESGGLSADWEAPQD